VPDSPDTQVQEPDTSMSPAGQSGMATTGGASQAPKPAMPPQGGPMGTPAKELGNIVRGRQLARAALAILEEAWSAMRNKTEEGQTLFKAIGMLSKHFGQDQEDKSQALMSSVRKQMTARPGSQPPPAAGGQAPQPPTGPIPQPGGAPGMMGGA
jgi:hypothetical protein